MQKSKLPNIDEIVGFIHTFDPAELEILVSDFPEYENILTPGSILGNKKSKTDKELKLRIEVCLVGLKSVLKQVEIELPILKNRIKSINRFQLGTHIISAVSGASILSLIESEGLKWVKYVAAALILLSAIFNLIIKFKSSSSESNTVHALFEQLVNHSIEAKYLKTELKILNQLSGDQSRERIYEIIGRANQLCVEISRIIEKQTIIG